MIYAILHGSLKTLIVPAAILAALGTQVQAEITYIKIKNCEKSKHEVRVASYANKQADTPDDSAHIHSGESESVYCDSSQCYMLFWSSAETVTKHTSKSPWYVHVKSNHSFSISNEASLCD